VNLRGKDDFCDQPLGSMAKTGMQKQDAYVPKGITAKLLYRFPHKVVGHDVRNAMPKA
jgi:hypothetical protein